ncbi:MAG: hypothetical protein AB1847_22365, partial [bacterium]
RENMASICHVGDSRVYHIRVRDGAEDKGRDNVSPKAGDNRSDADNAGDAGDGNDAGDAGGAGDSKITQVTRDHTVGDYLVAQKLMKPEDVPSFQWHVLTQAVGASESLMPETNLLKLEPFDILLLCSDGLNTMLTDSEIYQVISMHQGRIQEGAQALIDAANRKGGLDNISVILIECE